MRAVLIAITLFAAANCHADLLSNSSPPGLGGGATPSGVNAIFAPLAGRMTAACDLGAKRKVCGRVLADGTPQIGTGFYSCNTWVNSTYRTDYGNTTESTFIYQLTTSGLRVDHDECMTYGEYNCSTWKMSTTCIIQW